MLRAVMEFEEKQALWDDFAKLAEEECADLSESGRVHQISDYNTQDAGVKLGDTSRLFNSAMGREIMEWGMRDLEDILRSCHDTTRLEEILDALVAANLKNGVEATVVFQQLYAAFLRVQRHEDHYYTARCLQQALSKLEPSVSRTGPDLPIPNPHAAEIRRHLDWPTTSASASTMSWKKCSISARIFYRTMIGSATAKSRIPISSFDTDSLRYLKNLARSS